MKISPELLEKYARGECSPEENRAVESWMENTDEDESILKNVPFSEERAKRMRRSLKEATHNQIPRDNPISFHKNILIAASFLLLIGLGTFIFLNTRSEIYTTENGQVRTITLADGTKVTLNAGSRLAVASDFGGRSRKLFLQGEAFFDVAKDSLLPFIVQTDSSTTTVLGTQFNLSAYMDGATVLVLKEGKVAFSHEGCKVDSIFNVLPNQMVLLKSGILQKEEVNTDIAKAWMDKKLVFQSQKFSTVIAEVERFYGVQINIKKDGLEKRIYRGNHNNPSLEELMESMAFVLKFKYKIQGKNILIY